MRVCLVDVVRRTSTVRVRPRVCACQVRFEYRRHRHTVQGPGVSRPASVRAVPASASDHIRDASLREYLVPPGRVYCMLSLSLSVYVRCAYKNNGSFMTERQANENICTVVRLTRTEHSRRFSRVYLCSYGFTFHSLHDVLYSSAHRGELPSYCNE